MEKQLSREKTVVKTSIISIISNIVLSAFKALIGLISNSIAIITDAINNLTDALSSIITIIGTKLSSRKPDKKHPQGHGRIEYVTSFIVSAIVLYAGILAIVESAKKIANPETPDYTTFTIAILVSAILVKFFLGIYVKRVGRRVNSDSLVASGSDAFNDAILSLSVLVSAIIYLIFDINLEAYVGIIVGIFITKTGVELVLESINNIIGKRLDSDLSHKIKADVSSFDEVFGAYDLILNNYGPNKYEGSIHIEVMDTLTASEIDKLTRKIQALIYEKHKVILHTIGVYSINTKDERVEEDKKKISDIVFSHEKILQMHGFYIDYEQKIISFDIIMDFAVKNREEEYLKIVSEVQDEYKDYNLTINLDLDISD